MYVYKQQLILYKKDILVTLLAANINTSKVSQTLCFI